MSSYNPTTLAELREALASFRPFHSTRFSIGAEYIAVMSPEGYAEDSPTTAAFRNLYVPHISGDGSLTARMFDDARAYQQHYLSTRGQSARHREPGWTYRYVWAWDEAVRKRRIIAVFLASGEMLLDAGFLLTMPGRRRNVVAAALRGHEARLAGRIADTLAGEL